MTKKSFTIQEVAKEKKALNAAVLKLLQSFESKTGLRIGYIDTMRKRDLEGKGCGCCSPPMGPSEDRGPIQKVEINLHLDI